MGIWIRSQDRKGLVNPREIYIARRSKTWAICVNRGIDLGNYSTEEKAMKVLDMICKKIEINAGTEIEPVFYVVTQIFQMPKDEEVEA